MSILKRLIVEYEDSSTREIDFKKLGRAFQREICRVGVCSAPADAFSESYLLMHWKDGWKEVVAIDGDYSDLMRYYVIQRIEERGRLALEVGASYPQLFIIKRMPRDIDSLLIVGCDYVKYYELESEVETSDGIFELGGKREYVKYDKTDIKYPHESSDESKVLAELVNSLKHELDKKGLTAAGLLAKDQNTRIKEYKDIAQDIGIRGRELQNDVYGFIELIMRRLAT
jgi:hypothetical protein